MKLFIQYPKHIVRKPFKKNFEFVDLTPSGKIPKNLINNTFIGYKTITIKNNNKSEELLNIFQYLYENGGIYIQTLCNPDLFMKNREMVVQNIHSFSCIKNSPTLKKIISEVGTNTDMKTITAVFDKHTKHFGHKFYF